MCGRYTLTVTLEELMLRYWIEEARFPFHQPKYNVAPGQQVFAVIHDGTKRRLGQLKWGLVPPWADDPKIGFKMINARAETAAAKPAFAEPIRRKRCLIPADGFYEWKKQGNGKQPMRIALRDRAVFSFAGLYEIWEAPDGSRISSCTILTTGPNSLMSPIHDRMPVILDPADEPLWLERRPLDTGELNRIFKPYDADKLEAYPVTPAVGKADFDSPECIKPYRQDEQLELF